MRVRPTMGAAAAAIHATAFVCATAALIAACGGSDGCSGFISINASPERCMALAEQFGCQSFEATEGPSCGLVACARCEGEE